MGLPYVYYKRIQTHSFGVVRSRTKVAVRWTVMFKGIMHLNLRPRLYLQRKSAVMTPAIWREMQLTLE